MASAAVHMAMNGDKLFPLFHKPGPLEHNATGPIDASTLETNGMDGACDEKPSKSTKARKPRKKQIQGQKTLQEIVNPKAAAAAIHEEGNNGDETVGAALEDPSPRRSKRRRTSRTDSVEVGGQDEEPSNDQPMDRHSSPQVIVPASSPLPTASANAEKSKTPPKKMLRLRAGGKFSSPVSKKVEDVPEEPEPVRKRGRPRKAKEPETDKRLIAVVKFDVTSGLGERICRILAGEERYKKQVKILPKKQSTPRKANSSSAHPFFNLDRRKEQQQQPPAHPSTRKTSAVTPGKLRRETMHADQATHEVAEVWTSTLLKDRLMFRHPGAKEPAWPDREQVHVRGLAAQTDGPSTVDKLKVPALARRKRKAATKALSRSDSLLRHASSHLEAEKEGELRPDGFREPHPSLRLPKRLLIPGLDIARRVAPQLSVSLKDADADEIIYENSFQQSTQPALQATYDKITNANKMSAFDEGRGETTSWAHKYAPASCDEVLQPTRQTKVLRDWLSSLKVTAVDSSSRPDFKAASKAEAKPKKRKRRKKDDDLNDFLVDSDEETHDMDELTDPEDPPTSQGRKNLNSIVQVAAEGAKLSNAVLLSGPHGCGKTAAAYAAARELGFKVFEISSSERRSGKDVLDKVGDMTENHLVKHHGKESGEQSSPEQPNDRLDEAFQRDLASGRQGKMASFFKPQVKTQPKPKPKKKVDTPTETVKAKAVKEVQNALKKRPKDQQQSLILLEEVDILFKEDKEFWTTVLKLIVTSKRPFIMTCNDEDLVPLQAMSLHAILRFTPPPVDLATDYLLLIAAAEGHLLERKAVSSLYRNRDSDLRAAISELSLWCQMGVGDPRGGLEWIFQRYPPGCDLDANGRKLRVVSEGTFKSDMGHSLGRAYEHEEQLMWAWREHSVDATTALGWEALSDDNAAVSVEDLSKFADDLSAADVYARAQCSTILDTSQKAMSDKARTHYIEGLPLLQTDEQAQYSSLGAELLTISALFAFEARGLLSTEDIDTKLNHPKGHHHNHTQQGQPLTRQSFTCFDTISIPTDSALSTVSGLQQSVFDGPLNPIATDIAPYVRSIVHFGLSLAEQREMLGGGKSTKRARTTRAARSALEGGERASTRRERWFPKELDLRGVLATGGEGWPSGVDVASAEVGGGNATDEASSPETV